MLMSEEVWRYAVIESAELWWLLHTMHLSSQRPCCVTLCDLSHCAKGPVLPKHFHFAFIPLTADHGKSRREESSGCSVSVRLLKHTWIKMSSLETPILRSNFCFCFLSLFCSCMLFNFKDYFSCVSCCVFTSCPCIILPRPCKLQRVHKSFTCVQLRN